MDERRPDEDGGGGVPDIWLRSSRWQMFNTPPPLNDAEPRRREMSRPERRSDPLVSGPLGTGSAPTEKDNKDPRSQHIAAAGPQIAWN